MRKYGQKEERKSGKKSERKVGRDEGIKDISVRYKKE